MGREAERQLAMARQARAAGEPLAERAALEAALDDLPVRADLWNALAEVRFELFDYPAARDASARALALAPDDPNVAMVAALVDDACGDTARALERLRSVLARQPHDAVARANLASILERHNRIEEAEQQARSGLRTAPQDPLLNLVAARCGLRRRDLEACEAHLARVKARPGGARVLQGAAYLRGQLLDARGEHAAAFAAFTTANAIAAESARKRDADGAVYRSIVAAEHSAYRGAWASGWRALPEPTPLLFRPAFLVGFPRSGTTLLEQVLDAHPEIATVEEQPFVEELVGALAPLGYPAALATLTPALRAELRERYARRVIAHGIGSASVVIDKLPLNMVRAGLIQRLFPEARFLLALRHPYDAVLSCFMQEFGENMAMSNFYDLGSAATLYDAVFSLWARYREALPLAVCEVRYERVVEDLRAEVAPALEHLGLGWDEAVTGFAERARSRGIRTPSYSQVSQGLYRNACGRYRSYLSCFGEDAVRRLDPWVARLGYLAPLAKGA